MASFLQNNGDIILDAVLTDYGRSLLAKGDGSFKIAKFAFGDDEIDYSLFNPSAGTSLEDQQIMNTPILEAFTNNAASMKSQLMTLGVENILFLPILKQYNKGQNKNGDFGPSGVTLYNGYVVPVDISTISSRTITSDALTSSADAKTYLDGVLNVVDRHIRIDQGLDSLDLNSQQSLKETNPALYETEYNVYVDNRFCSVGMKMGDNVTTLTTNNVDDDNVAMYKLTEQIISNTSYVSQIQTNVATIDSVINGTKGSKVTFTVIPNSNLLFTDSMFKKYGKEMILNPYQETKTFHTLRMPIKIVGVTTGYSIEIPVLFAKLKQ